MGWDGEEVRVETGGREGGEDEYLSNASE